MGNRNRNNVREFDSARDSFARILSFTNRNSDQLCTFEAVNKSLWDN
jgi:hypothetical protein